jgi:RNA-directed DNA polymerase
MQGESTVNGTERLTDWHGVNWRRANRVVRNLRQRIFRASKEGDLRKVASLQKLMLRSHSNVLDSVRRVTQLNDGKKTPGVDNKVALNPKTRAMLADEISAFTPWKAKPTRRVYIPKANGKLRPLGIPVVKDRCLQAMVKNALEPFWEARFEGVSYGFRPGRSCHDAIGKIYLLARPNKLKKWVMDADIKGAFDNISHEHLLKAVGMFPARELIKQWLKAGYVDGGVFQETEAGTPQGGVISPLLANIALHGMEDALTVRKTLPDGKVVITGEGVKYRQNGQLCGKRAVVRYADDFVVFCESKEDAEKSVSILTGWLKERGLTLSPEKTRIVHLSEGFDFLGFNIRHYKAPKTSKSGWKLLIRPSKKSVQKIREKLRDKWVLLRSQNVKVVIKELNPVIRGWANYFRIGVAKEVFCLLDHWITEREIRYVKRMHPTKPRYWTQTKYFGRLNTERGDNWVFGDKQTGMFLQMFKWFPIERHALVQGNASPDDPSLRDYWAKRMAAKAKDLVPSRQKIARKQKGLCLRCGESLFNGEEIHLHHKVWKSKGGEDKYSNFELVHLFCHQQIHAA